MDKNEKKIRKEKLSKYVDLANGRFKDHEIEELEHLVKNRKKLNGTTKTFKSSYKTFDSEDTYRVTESDTYIFNGNEDKISIGRDFQRKWDDGQNDKMQETFQTGRDILNNISKLFKK